MSNPTDHGPSARIGVLGGTFDPIHIGHLVIAEAARLELGLGRVLFVPASAQPFKLDRPTTPASHRLAMVQLAVADNDAFAVSTVDIDRETPSYTADTLRLLVERGADASGAGNQAIYFVCGADALLDMEHWYRPDEILRLATIAVARRPGCGDDAVQDAAARRLTERYGGRVTFFAAPRLDISSSEVRERLAGGRAVRYLVPDAVLAYAAAHDLYGAGTAS
jgi:nicotinate-nucleotide adenylyltransferase